MIKMCIMAYTNMYSIKEKKKLDKEKDDKTKNSS